MPVFQFSRQQIDEMKIVPPGIVNVYIDGVLKTSVDTYSAGTKYQVVQYTITGLAPGNHTIRIEAIGQQNSSAASAWVWVDGFDVAN